MKSVRHRSHLRAHAAWLKWRWNASLWTPRPGDSASCNYPPRCGLSSPPACSGPHEPAERWLLEQGHPIASRSCRRFRQRLREESTHIIAQLQSRPDRLTMSCSDSRLSRLALDRMYLKHCGAMPFARLPQPLLEELAHRLLTPGAVVSQVQDWLMTKHRVGRSSIYRFNQVLRLAADEVMRGAPLALRKHRSPAQGAEKK